MLIVALAATSLLVRLGAADQGTQPTAQTGRRAYDLLTQRFGPGFNGGRGHHGHRLRRFVLSADRIPKEFGLLLGVAILTDALIVRMTLVPALLTCCANGRGTSRAGSTGVLPNLTIEPPHDGEAPRPADAKRTEAAVRI